MSNLSRLIFIVSCGIAVAAAFVAGRVSTPDELAPVKNAKQFRAELAKLGSSERDFRFEDKRDALLLQERLAASDVEAIAREFMQDKLLSSDTYGLQMLFAIMAERDAEAAWNLASTLPPSLKDDVMCTVMRILARESSENALAKLDTIEDRELHRSLRDSISHHIDPRRALSLLDISQEGESHSVRSIFATWAKRDLQAALAVLPEVEARWRMSAFVGIVEALAVTDPAAAWELASTNGIKPNRGRYERDARIPVIAIWASRDPQAALEAVVAVREEMEPVEYSRLLSNVFTAWAEKDYDAVFEYITTLSDQTMLYAGFDALVEGYLRSMASRRNHSVLLEEVLKHPPIEETQSTPVRRDRERTPSEQYGSIVFHIMANWTRENPREAAAAAAQLPPEAHFMGTGAVASTWIRETNDFDDILDWLIQTEGNKKNFGCMESMSNTHDLFRKWATRDPVAAIAATAKFSEARERDSALRTIARKWGENNPQAAIEWATKQQDEKLREKTIETVLTTIAETDPPKALALLDTLKLDDANNIISRIIEQWKRHDAEAAKTWVEKSNLPEDIKNRLMR